MMSWFKKRYLIKYTPTKFQSLNSRGVDYNMTIKTVYPFGFTRVSNVIVTVNRSDDLPATKLKWDQIITTKQLIN